MTKFLTRLFFNQWYKIRPPEMVEYWKRGDSARAKVEHAKDGSLQMQIEGEKYPMSGFPRGHIIEKGLAKMKSKVKNRVFNEVFSEIERMADGMKYDMLPEERMTPAVRELHRALKDLENAEVVPDMKGRIKLIRRVLCFFLQEDDAYRMRMQWVLERMDMKKMKLTKADKYFFRGKYFKVDHSHYDY